MKSLLLAAIAASVVYGQTTPASIRISTEITPPGGTVQTGFLMTEPKPIIITTTEVDMPIDLFDEALGIALASPNGDAGGAARIAAGRGVQIYGVSPSGSLGTTVDYPFLTIVSRIKATARPGTSSPVSFDAGQSFWLNLLGTPYPVELANGAIQVGGSMYISNVLPGGGFVEAGKPFYITGGGFAPGVNVRIEAASGLKVEAVTPTLIRLSAKTRFRLDGARVVVSNPRGERQTYYSYLRGVAAAQSASPELAGVWPIFPLTLSSQARVALGPHTSLAVQNPNANPVTFEVTAYTAAGESRGRASRQLQAGQKLTLTAAEWLPGANLAGAAYVEVKTGNPSQVLGLEIDPVSGAIAPVFPAVIR